MVDQRPALRMRRTSPDRETWKVPVVKKMRPPFRERFLKLSSWTSFQRSRMKDWTILQAHCAFRRHTTDVTDLSAHHFNHIQSINKSSPSLNGIVAVSWTAWAQPDVLDKHFAEQRKLRCLLHGISVTTKDQADTQWLMTTY